MIEITQGSSLKENNINMEDIIKVHINRELVTKDIKRLNEYSTSVTNKYDKVNIQALIKYLEKLLKLTDDNNEIELCWDKKEDEFRTYPISLINAREYNINSCNYIEIESGQKLVELDLTCALELVAFEMMYRDLGEDHASIENLLKDCGLTTYEDSNIILDYFKENGDDMYALSQSMKVGDTPYYSFKSHSVEDYFKSKRFSKSRYAEPVNYSSKNINRIILNNIIKNAQQAKIDIKPLMLTNTHIAFIVSNIDDLDIIDKGILDDMSIRTFGRKFLLHPTVKVF